MQLSEALTQIDGMVDLVSALILENQPEATEQAIRQLRDGMAAFVGLSQRFGAEQRSPENVAHMEQISERLAVMRNHIVKMGAMTQQQLQALMPQQSGGGHTYGGAASSQPSGAAAAVSKLYHISG